MQLAWRIVSARLEGSAFDGEGAKLFGGRWNSPGIAAIYSASSRSLAALEILAHFGSGAPGVAFLRFEIRIPDSMVTVFDCSSLDRAWLGPLIHPETRQRGDAWLESCSSLALSVPSAIIPEEPNYLINPRHPDFLQLEILKPELFSLDPRLMKSAPRVTPEKVKIKN